MQQQLGGRCCSADVEMIVFACHKLNSPIRELRLDFFH